MQKVEGSSPFIRFPSKSPRLRALLHFGLQIVPCREVRFGAACPHFARKSLICVGGGPVGTLNQRRQRGLLALVAAHRLAVEFKRQAGVHVVDRVCTGFWLCEGLERSDMAAPVKRRRALTLGGICEGPRGCFHARLL